MPSATHHNTAAPVVNHPQSVRADAKTSRPLWIFGYGSLIWRPDFPFVQQRLATTEGWQRRFCQASTDHRGTAEYPGRVVTLTAAPECRSECRSEYRSEYHCTGMAFLVEPQRHDEVLEYLDRRESGGYTSTSIELFLKDSSPGDGKNTQAGDREQGSAPIRGITWIARPENPNYRAQEAVPSIAARVRRAVGPSGTNREYVVRLARALEELGIQDPHVEELHAALGPPRRSSA